MSVTLGNIQNNYIQNLPSEVPTKIVQGFIATTAIHLINGSASSMALVAGSVAATSTIIEAITRPIIKAVFPKDPMIAQCVQFTIPQMIAVVVVRSIAPWFASSSTIISLLMSCIAWSFLNDRYFEKNVGMAALY